jgi:hypothetical protein
MKDAPQAKCTRYYYVDESGDGVIFSRRGKLLLGQPGSLRFFMLGLLDVSDPVALQSDLDTLRREILSDPYFAGVPSLKKTARAFHAKDDLPEVRREVFRTLLRHDLKFSAIIKDLYSVADYVRNRNLRDPHYRYHPNELYDFTVRRLFKARLHKEELYHVFLAVRGQTNQTRTLRQSMESARNKFCHEKGLPATATLHVQAAYPHEHAGLQAADYFLWALQRLFNSKEERFIQMIWDKVSVVEDADDTRNHGYGEFYNKRKIIHYGAIERGAKK